MSKKILYIGLFFFTLIFFFQIIPLDFQYNHTGLLGAVGAIVTMVFGFMGLLQFFPVKDEQGQAIEYKGSDNLGCLLVVGVIAFIVLFGGVFVYEVSRRAKKEFSENGAFAVGTIVDGSSIKTRKADFTSLTLKFLAIDGKEYVADLDISASEFSNYYMYQQIPLRYSKKYPGMIEKITDKALMLKLYVESMPEVNVNELTKIFRIKTPEAVLEHLNTINKQWITYSPLMAKNMVYINQLKHISISVLDGRKLVYVYHSMNDSLFNKELKELGFVAVQGNTSESSSFKNEKFLINIHHGVSVDTSSNATKLVTVVDIDKVEDKK